jgi:hypothetical protein
LAEDWREYLGEGRDEVRLLEGLVQDLEADTALSEVMSIPINERAVRSGVWLQANWVRSDLPADSIEWALDGLHRGMPYASTRTEYEAAKNSGRLDLLQNRSLRRLINSHYEQSHAVIGEVSDLNLRFHFEFVEAIRPHIVFDDVFETQVDLRLDPLNPTLGEDWPNLRFRKPWEEVQQDHEARALLAQTNTFRRLVVNWHRIRLREMHDLRLAILEELAGR